MTITLGIADGHNASAALMQNGKIIGIVQEERLTKRKNFNGFPLLAVKELIANHLNNDPHSVDKVLFSTTTFDPYFSALDHYSSFGVFDWIKEMKEYWYPYFYRDRESVSSYWRDLAFSAKDETWHNYDLSFIDKMSHSDAIAHFNGLERQSVFRRHFKSTPEFQSFKHHECHAYYALFGTETSFDIEDTLVLTADSMGDGQNWSAWVVDSNLSLKMIGGGKDHTVARIYKFITLILGMKPNEHEYKVMGLSAYPRSDNHVNAVARIMLETLDFEDGQFVSRAPLRDSYFDLKDRLEGHRFDNVAAGVQLWASNVTCKWVRYWCKISGKSNVCFSGGLSMNIKINGDILALKEVRSLLVPASGGDESISAGSCFVDAAKTGIAISPMSSVYLGSMALLSGWDARLSETPLKRNDFSLLEGVGPELIAKLLAKDVIVARCSGRAEFGARSLGNRAILANPANPQNIDRLNTSIKNRDFWMPFTPSIMFECSSEYIINPKQTHAPHMTIGFDTTAKAVDIAAAVHPADRSARPQIVRRNENRDYWELIAAFRERTGIGALLNTSLNLHGEPMNYTVADAVRTMALSDLACLEVEGTLICKGSRLKEIRAALSAE